MNKNEIAIAVLICILGGLALIPDSALALTYGNLEVNLLKSSADYPALIAPYVAEKSIYTPQCLFECHMPLMFRWTGAANINLDRSELKAYKTKISGLDDISEIRMLYLDNETYTENIWTPNIVCDNSNLINGTYPNICSDQGSFSTVTKWRGVWKPVPASITIVRNKWYIVDIVGKRTAGLKPSAVDIVPEIKGIQMPEFAWWNNSWSYRQIISVCNINSSTMPVKYPIMVNSTSFSLATCIAGGKCLSTYNDVRMAYYNGTWVEIPRTITLRNHSVWFETQATVSGTSCTPTTESSGAYAIYYGNPTAGATSLTANFNAPAPDANTISMKVMNTNVSNSRVYDLVNSSYDGFLMNGAKTIESTDSGSYGGYLNCSGNADSTMDIPYLFDQTAFPSAGTISLSFRFNQLSHQVVIWNKWMDFTGGTADQSTMTSYDSTGYVLSWYNQVNNVGAHTNSPEKFTAPSVIWRDLTAVWSVAGNSRIYYTNNTLQAASTFTAPTKGNILNFTLCDDKANSGLEMPGQIGWMRIQNVSQNQTINFYAVSIPVLAMGTEESPSSASPTTTTLTINGASANATHAYTPLTADNFTATSNTTGLYVAIYTNGTLRANTTTAATYSNIWGVGLLNVTAVTQGNANYTTSSSTWWLNITKTANVLSLYIENSTAKYYSTTCNATFCTIGYNINGGTYPANMSVCGTCTSGSPVLYENSVDTTSVNCLWSVRGVTLSQNVSMFCPSNANYTANRTFDQIDVTQGTPTITVAFNTSQTVTQGTPVLVTCNYPYGLTTKLYNTTDEVTNPVVVDTTLLNGAYGFICNTTGNANYTSGFGTNILTVTLSGALLIDSVVDEQNISKSLTFDVEVFNSSYSATSSGITSYNNNVVTGAITIVISSSGYGTRRYYVEIPAEGSYNMTGYLLNNSDGQFVAFTVKDYSDTLIENAKMNIERLLPTWQNVSTVFTDSSGKTVVFLDPQASYRMTITKSGYDTKVFFLTPALTAYTIFLTGTAVDLPSYWDYYSSLTASCKYTNATRILNCTWTGNANLTGMTLTVLRTLANSTTASLCANTTANTSGTLLCNFGPATNSTYNWRLTPTFTDGTSYDAATGVWSDGRDIGLGNTGLAIAFFLVLLMGSVGFVMKSPVLTVMMTLIGTGASFLMGFIALDGTMMMFFIGLVVAGGIVIFKMR